MNEEEKEDIELDIEAKYVDRTEKEFLSNITYAECLYILDTKNKYCDDIKNLSLLKIVDIVNEQSKEIEELKEKNENLLDALNNSIFITKYWVSKSKIKDKIEELDEEIKVKREIAKNPMDRVSGRLLTDNIVELEKTKKVLQSLLEKE